MSTSTSSCAHAVLALGLGLLLLHQAGAACVNWDNSNSFETGTPGATNLGDCAVQAASTKVTGDGFAVVDYNAEGAPGHAGPAPGDDSDKQGAALKLSKAGKATMVYSIYVDPLGCWSNTLSFAWFACGDETKFSTLSTQWPSTPKGQAARIDLFNMNQALNMADGDVTGKEGTFLTNMMSTTAACDSSKGCLSPIADPTTVYNAVSDPSGCGWHWANLDLLPYAGSTIAVVVRAADDLVSATQHLELVVDDFSAHCEMEEQGMPSLPPPRPSANAAAPEPPLPPVIAAGPAFPCCSTCDTRSANTPFKLQARPTAVLDSKTTEMCFDIAKSTVAKAGSCSNMGIKKVEINVDATCKYAIKGAYWKHDGKVERVTTSFDTCGSTLVWKVNNMTIASASKYVSKSSKLCLKVQTGKCSSLASLCAGGAVSGKCQVAIFSNWTKGAPRCCPVTEMAIPNHPKSKLLR